MVMLIPKLYFALYGYFDVVIIISLTSTKLPDVRERSLCLSRFISVLACSYLGYTVAGRATPGIMIADVSDRLLSLA